MLVSCFIWFILNKLLLSNFLSELNHLIPRSQLMLHSLK